MMISLISKYITKNLKQDEEALLITDHPHAISKTRHQCLKQCLKPFKLVYQ